MRDGEPNIYTALAILRNGQTQLQWGRIQMLLVFNTVAIPVVAGAGQYELVKLALSMIGLAVHIALVGAAIRGSNWIDYWGERIAELERLDSEESSSDGVRVKVFSHPDFYLIHKRGVFLKKIFMWVGIVLGLCWLVTIAYYLLNAF